MAKKKNIVIKQGETFTLPCRVEGKPIVYRPIKEISKTAPVVIKTEGNHGIKPNWRVAIVSARGMTRINASNTPPSDSDYHKATIESSDEISLNDVNAANFSAYTGGGYVQFNTPIDLTGSTARLAIRNKRDKTRGTELYRMTTENGRIVIDAVNCVITLVISATDTASFAWTTGYYELDVISSTGVVATLLEGSITISKEVTA